MSTVDNSIIYAPSVLGTTSNIAKSGMEFGLPKTWLKLVLGKAVPVGYPVGSAGGFNLQQIKARIIRTQGSYIVRTSDRLEKLLARVNLTDPLLSYRNL